MKNSTLTYEQFLKELMTYRKLLEDFRELYKMGFDFLEGKFKLEENVSKMLDAFLESHFEEAGIDWVHWFIYENDWREKDWGKLPVLKEENGKWIIDESADPMKAYGAKDEDGNPICYSYESTWECVKEYLK